MSETCDRFEMESIAENRHFNADDSSEFSDLDERDRWTDSTSNSDCSQSDDDISTSSSTTLKLELEKQNVLKNNLSIVGIPQKRDEDLRGIFLKVCKLLGARISNNDIKSIRRDILRSMIHIEFRDHEVKAHICKYSHAKYLWSDEVMRLPSGMMRSRIYINDQMTYFYKQMWEIGRMARKNGLIFTSWITDRGFMTKRTSTSQKRYFLSPQHLNRYVGSLHKMDKQGTEKRSGTVPRANITKRRRIERR